jgi:internalin A
VPVIVVINFSDQHELLLDQHTYKKRFPNIKKFLYTSATEVAPLGIDELKQDIKKEVDNLKHVRGEISVKWLNVKSELEALRDEQDYNYIPWSKYAAICSKYDLCDQDEQRVLIDFLHSLGTVSNFRLHNEKLEDTNVLNPVWVTKGIYQILNSQIHHQGHIKRSELINILPQEWYPDMKHRQFIIDVMVQFELCYEIPRHNNRGPIQYIVPDLLNPEQPKNLKWNPPAPLRFQYDFEVLPQAIVTRFIVHAIDRPTMAYWRDGIHFRIEDNECLFIADRNDNKIYIEISGVDAERRRALSVIRDEITRIIYLVKDLEFHARVPLPEDSNISVSNSHLLKLEKEGIEEFLPEGASRFYNVSELLEGISTSDERSSYIYKDITTAQQRVPSKSDYKLKQIQPVIIISDETQSAIRGINVDEGTIRQAFKSALKDFVEEIIIAHRRGTDVNKTEEILNLLKEISEVVKPNRPLSPSSKESLLSKIADTLMNIETITRVPEIGSKLGKLAETIITLMGIL